MTVKEMFESKYRETMANITEREWQRVTENAAQMGIHPAEYIITNLVITENECNPRKNADVYWELIKLNENKLIASNRHRQYSGKTTAFWLTKKGYKKLFAE
jgi:prophage tail gpP-like protein